MWRPSFLQPGAQRRHAFHKSATIGGITRSVGKSNAIEKLLRLATRAALETKREAKDSPPRNHVVQNE
jgi:hypothetical protein